ncbi:hypothetical protein LSH36_366g01019 [Paralvinella palmiformis]|uniref:Uncharacterized protein n=1 Tax=Paralvinella palmiformis TaxID=53620 RepID=A0AAD9JDW6_9ANNE|nr:hypothetical protein LSH36_366g01019 [Paralvinella palmiformis]
MSMRHVRDPITGAKIGEAANQNPESIVRPRPTFKDAASKVVYVNMGTVPPPPPSVQPPSYVDKSSPSPRSSSLTSPRGSETPTSLSHVYYQSRTPSPPPGQKNVTYINHESRTPRWPVRGRSPSPRRSVLPEYTKPQQRPFGHNSRFVTNKNGSAYHVGKTYQGAQWRQRRCYALLWGILLILLLAALAAGIYFLVKYVEAQQALSAPDVLYPGGYYENGLYIVTSTVAPPESWGIIGHDRPCNPYNNNTERSVLRPNCSRLTTIIIPINYTTTTAPLLVTLSSGSRLTNGVLMILPVVLSSCFAGSASVSDM